MVIRDEHIRQIKNGDIKAFKDFYNSFFDSMAIFSFQIVRESEVAKDIIHDTFLIYWQKRFEFETVDGVKAYLYAVIRNKALTFIRNRNVEIKNQKHFEIEYDDIVKREIILEETFQILHNAIDSLPPQMKKIIRLTMKGLKNQEMSEELGISINTVKTLKKNAYKQLRERMKNNVYAMILLAVLLD